MQAFSTLWESYVEGALVGVSRAVLQLKFLNMNLDDLTHIHAELQKNWDLFRI